MKVDGWRWQLRLEIFRFWCCFCWIFFFHFMRSWFFVLCFHLFVFFISVTMFTFHLILNDHVCLMFFFSYFWIDFTYGLVTKYAQIKYFKTEEPILLMFWLQNRYKSNTLKLKNRLGPESESTSGCTGSLKIY